jgi:uncharacterized protein YyaL (SSP411 family)
MASSMIMRLLFQFIELYQATFNEKWLYKEKELNDYAITHFMIQNQGCFFIHTIITLIWLPENGSSR